MLGVGIPSTAVAHCSVPMRLLLFGCLKSAVALSSFPVHVFVLLLSGCGGVFSSFIV